MDPAVVVALVTAITSLLIAGLSGFFSFRSNRSLGKLNHDLAKQRADRDARRDYEYEARKRLYEDCEPLLFQQGEASQNAIHRVYSLARAARTGDLANDESSWLNNKLNHEYYMNTTIYLLLAPLAFYKLIQRRLTVIDLNLEPRIRTQYEILRLLYLSFGEGLILQNEPQSCPIQVSPGRSPGRLGNGVESK